jgi:hypothetical protein
VIGLQAENTAVEGEDFLLSVGCWLQHSIEASAE